jgi:hypothetical protein
VSRALACALPAMVLATLLLLPFLNTPFTIDDPIYLREAQHALVDPLHPQAFNMVWSTDLNLRVSQILPGGVAMPYLLIPTALADCAEWAGHLTQLLLLLAALFASALAALRFGLDAQQARLVAFLTAACPAVLGMAGTVMPDIAAMLFVTLGMERVIAWRDHRKWHQALLATCWLTLAVLTRTHTILVLAPAFVLLLDGASFLPILLTPVAFLMVSALTADPEFHGENVLASMLQLPGGLHLMVQNGFAFLAHWLLVIPLTIPWLALRFRRLSTTSLVVSLLGASVLSLRLGWVAFAGAATFVVLVDIAQDAIERRDRVQLALWLWLFLALPVVIYVHLPCKYLLPSVPAAAMLVIREARRDARWLILSVATAGVMLGLLILSGTRDLAQTQRRAVADLIDPHVKLGERVWFAGHWGFQWYAELAGASPVTLQPPFPQPGDIIVVSEIDLPRFPRTWTSRKVLRRLSYPNGVGRVMDIQAHVGFFSSIFGILPWIPGSGEANSFEVWKESGHAAIAAFYRR